MALPINPETFAPGDYIREERNLGTSATGCETKSLLESYQLRPKRPRPSLMVLVRVPSCG